MTFIAKTCPNCSAPLQVTAGSQSAICDYCRSTFVQSRESSAAQRATIATEKTAEEIALARLMKEKYSIEYQLGLERNRAQASRDSEYNKDYAAYKTALSKYQSKEFERKLNSELAGKVRMMFLLGEIPVIFLIFVVANYTNMGGDSESGVFLGSLFLLLLGGAVLAQMVQFLFIGQMPPSPPRRRPQPKLPPSENEIRLAQRLTRIDEEIMRHRQLLEESKPAYAAIGSATQQNRR